jgi:hypothetical protein
MKDRAKSVSSLVESIEGEGLPGLVKTAYRMIGENQPSVDCLKQADDDFASASTPEDVWDAALGMADCLRDAILEPEDPEPPEPPEPPPPPPPPPPRAPHDRVADVMLAALLVHVHGQGKTGRPEVQQKS